MVGPPTETTVGPPASAAPVRQQRSRRHSAAPGDAHHAVLQGPAQRLEDVAPVERELVEEQHAVVGECLEMFLEGEA